MVDPEKRWIDRQAFRDLYREYFPRVYGYIAYRVGNRQDTEDLVSETFMRVLEKLPTFEYRGEGSFAAWIFRIAHNLVVSFHRKKPLEVALDDIPELPQHEPHLAYLHDLIQRLPRRRQEVITLRFFAGLRNREIAEVLQLDERTVASHLSRALEDLYQNMVEERHE